MLSIIPTRGISWRSNVTGVTVRCTSRADVSLRLDAHRRAIAREPRRRMRRHWRPTRRQVCAGPTRRSAPGSIRHLLGRTYARRPVAREGPARTSLDNADLWHLHPAAKRRWGELHPAARDPDR